MDGQELILDSDGDTSITADTDDQIDFKIGGSDVMVSTAASLTHTGTFEPSGDTAAGDNAAMGYTALDGLVLTGQGSSSDVVIKNDADAIVCRVQTGTTNLTFAAGIHIGGLGAANLISDYEEGTWTPILSDGTNNASSNITTGTYTKIGRLVHCKGRLSTSSLGSVSGNLRITGAPFTSASGTNTHSTGSVGLGQFLAITASESVSIFIGNSESFLTLTLWDSAGGGTLMQESEWTADGEIMFDVTYYV